MKKIKPKINIKFIDIYIKVWVLKVHPETVGDSKSLSPTARGNFMNNTKMSYIHVHSHDRDNGHS